MKKIFYTLAFALTLFVLSSNTSFAANDFLCQCAVTGQFGACAGWQAANVSCDANSQAVADDAHCGVCGGAGSECIVSCTPKSQTSTRNYGEICTQVGNITVTCNSDPSDKGATVTCRPDSSGTSRCLKPLGALGSGTGTTAGSTCKDSNECSGYNNSGFNSICTNLPNTSGSGQQTFNTCTIEQYRTQFTCSQSGTVFKCTKQTTNEPPASGGNGSSSTVQIDQDKVGKGCVEGEISTAIGCVPYNNINTFAGFFLRWGLGFAGGVGMLFTIYASFLIMTSQGDPKRLQSGKELLMSAVSGIILIVFSVFILRLLGVNILGIF